MYVELSCLFEAVAAVPCAFVLRRSDDQLLRHPHATWMGAFLTERYPCSIRGTQNGIVKDAKSILLFFVIIIQYHSA